MIGLFVDGSYLRKAWHASGGGAFDYAGLCRVVELKCGDTIALSYWFDAHHPDPYENERRRRILLAAGFRPRIDYGVRVEALRSAAGVPLRDPRTNAPLHVTRQKGVDVGLALAIERSYRLEGWNQSTCASQR